MSRTVTERPTNEPDPEMSVIGYALAALTVLVLLPLLPFLGALWVLARFLGSSGERERGRGRERPPRRSRRGA